ncbi:MAG: AbiV family abortive infection protein [Candidatus Omnitrophica bacterium]|nr:AbiV family abortive infection protein [Candidatus Omnitrophota bacterium]
MFVVKLNSEQIEEGIYKCIEKSKEIIKGAEYLYKKHLFQLAISLLLLAAEESGKAVLIYRTLLLDQNHDNGWKKFWDNYEKHNVKLTAGLWTWTENFFNLDWDTQFGKTIRETQGENIADFNLLKQHGFYSFFNTKRKIFEIEGSNLYEWGIIKWGVKLYLSELCELKKVGFFTTVHLDNLRHVFAKGEGKRLLLKYKKVKKLKTLPNFKKEYDQFLKNSELDSLNKLYKKALRRAAYFK